MPADDKHTIRDWLILVALVAEVLIGVAVLGLVAWCCWHVLTTDF